MTSIFKYITFGQHLAICKLLSSDYNVYNLPHNMVTIDGVEFSDVTAPHIKIILLT